MTLDALVRAVEARIDEIVGAGSTATIDRRAVTEPAIAEAARRMLRTAPRRVLLRAAEDLASSGIEVGEADGVPGGVRIRLGSKALRVFRVRLPDWRRPVVEFGDEDSEAYGWQFAPFTRADRDRPAAFVVGSTAPASDGANPTGVLAIEAWPYTAAEVAPGGIETEFEATITGVTDLSPVALSERAPHLVVPLTWLAASIVAIEAREDDAATVASSCESMYAAEIGALNSA